MNLERAKCLRGIVTVPGDKSISHRAVMFGALAEGRTEITNFLQGADCLSTIDCFRQMGLSIEVGEACITVHGRGLHGLKAPLQTMDVGNSGTTARLLCGILAGQSFSASLTGDHSICKRPMQRIMTPLADMGARISCTHNNNCLPLSVHGTRLTGISYHSPIASAQVKSAVLLAGLYADQSTSVTEPFLSRNHSEIMLQYFGAEVDCHNTTATISPNPRLAGQKVEVPGDISSAAYFIAAGLLVPDSELLIKNVGINPTRAGLLTVCQNMGADLTLLNQHLMGGEPTADILIRSSQLKGTTIEGAIVPSLIDELPIIAVMACHATGQTVIRDAQELRVKECNRINVMVSQLAAMGARITATEDGMIIEGGSPLRGITVNSHLDHRIAMSFSIAALIADGITSIPDSSCTEISYPSFYQDLFQLFK